MNNAFMAASDKECKVMASAKKAVDYSGKTIDSIALSIAVSILKDKGQKYHVSYYPNGSATLYEL